jgi:hypothetical protein
MNNRSRDEDSWFLPVEMLIRAAGNYVVPSDNLRPKTLEVARELATDRLAYCRLGGMLLLMLFFGALSVPALDRLNAWHGKSVSPSAAEIQEQAARLSTKKGVGPDWGLFEAFNQLRIRQAANLSPSQNKLAP